MRALKSSLYQVSTGLSLMLLDAILEDSLKVLVMLIKSGCNNHISYFLYLKRQILSDMPCITRNNQCENKLLTLPGCLQTVTSQQERLLFME